MSHLYPDDDEVEIEDTDETTEETAEED